MLREQTEDVERLCNHASTFIFLRSRSFDFSAHAVTYSYRKNKGVRESTYSLSAWYVFPSLEDGIAYAISASSFYAIVPLREIVSHWWRQRIKLAAIVTFYLRAEKYEFPLFRVSIWYHVSTFDMETFLILSMFHAMTMDEKF